MIKRWAESQEVHAGGERWVVKAASKVCDFEGAGEDNKEVLGKIMPASVGAVKAREIGPGFPAAHLPDDQREGFFQRRDHGAVLHAVRRCEGE